MARRRARRAGDAAAPVRRGRRRARRGARRARGPQLRPHAGQRPLGGRQRPGLPELLRRRSGAAVRPADPGRRRHRPDVPRAARRRRRSSCPGTSRCRSPRWGFAPALAAGNTRGAQAGRADPAHRDPDRRAGAARPGLPEHVLTVLPGQGLGGRRAVRHPPAGPQGLLHRLHRGRQADHGRLRRAGEAGDPGARRQELQHRLRGRRHRGGGRRGAVRRLRQRRPGLLRPVADPGRAVGVRRVPRAARARRDRRCGCSTPPTRPARWGR